ncbi:DNA primase [Sphingomonas hengshuiensis]|uniref:DNA primase n=1 Tax=Sphingomonas hengshuiensis TaxID=1609977 RepID=UPI0006976291|nr:DNA primase [Sphingomonas hengshuiensis]
MALSQQFLDELRARSPLSAMVGRALKLTKAGREYRACCPFHNEKTASFYVNDDKGFYHCFGCGAHGDAIRWLTEHEGLDFIEAVKTLADAAGMDVPAPSQAAQDRAARIDGIRPALEAAQALFARELEATGVAREYLAARGIDAAAIARFGMGWAPARSGYVRGLGVSFEAAVASGLIWQADGKWGETFRARITVPVHDARGRLIGFGGRLLTGDGPKYKNSPDSEIFDKGATLFNLHVAAPAARTAKRIIVVEGYMDVIALDSVGIAEVVAPMGTALTCGGPEALGGQLERLWRVVDRPILAFDGDVPGRAAAIRACTAALPHIAPGRSLAVALFPQGQDPDDVARSFDPAIPGGREEQGRRAVEAVLTEAVPIAALLFDAVAAGAAGDDPEAVAGVWQQLDTLARTIRDEETRAQYLAAWRARYEREVSLSGPSGPSVPALHSQIEAEGGGYAWPETQEASERNLIAIVRRLLELRAERAEINQSIRDIMAVSKAAGFAPGQINAVLRDLEADPSIREEKEAVWALYRRVMGVRGPIETAILPSPADARAPKVVTAMQRRLSRTMALIDAREVGNG